MMTAEFGDSMRIDQVEQDRRIWEFVKTRQTEPEHLAIFFKSYVLHPDHEVEFTHKVAGNITAMCQPLFKSLSIRKRFHLVKALAKLFEVSLDIKYWEYQLSREDANWFWQGFPLYFKGMAHMIESLEVMRHELGVVSKKNLHHKFVAVEGGSELEFIFALQFTRLASFDFEVYPYGGKGELRNLIHLIREKNRQGVLVFVTYDRDGRSKSFVKKLKLQCKVERFFGFRRDFEGAFPPNVLCDALNLYTQRTGIANPNLEEEEVLGLLKGKKPFVKALEERWRVSVRKPELGFCLGATLAQKVDLHWGEIADRKQRQTKFPEDIYRFLDFIMKY